MEAAERQEELKKKLLGSQEMVEKAISWRSKLFSAGPGAVEGAGTELEGTFDAYRGHLQWQVKDESLNKLRESGFKM